MFDIPLFDNQYHEALLYLLDQIDLIKACSDNNEPWYPKDEERLDEALNVYWRWHPNGKNSILDFPWPKPGEIPKVPADYLRPADEEKNKIKAFIKKHEGTEMDPLTETLVQLAKDLIQEVHWIKVIGQGKILQNIVKTHWFVLY